MILLKYSYIATQTSAEARFKNTVIQLINEGIYPSPQNINESLRGHRYRNISGRECKWRREICKEVSFKLKGIND